jgi:PAS domain S-box-containing protein/putative nucleotidyltransferase with HDIG domain
MRQHVESCDELKVTLARVEKQLAESEKRYRLLVENAADVIWTVDMNMKLSYISPSITQLLGYTVEEAFSRNMEDIFSADSYRKAMYVLAEELEAEKSSNVDRSRSRVLELDLIHKNGSIIPAEIKYTFIRDKSDIPQEILAVARNISERREAEELILEEKKFLDNIFDSLPGIFYILNEKAEIIRWNKNEEIILEYSSEELMNRNALETIAEEDRELVAERVANVFASGYSSVVANAVTKSGKKIPLYLTGARVSKDNRDMLVGMGIDITEQKSYEEKSRKAVEELKEAINGAIEAIAMITEMRDPYTAGHQRRVADLSSAIAGEMGLSQEQVSTIRIAGILHDVGKASIPMEILCKPVALDPMEMDIIKLHPKVGYDILKSLKLPWPIGPAVLQHHERINGTGYPNGLIGDEITLEARILAVADVVEAMSSNRPYRPSLGIQNALNEIEQNKGVLYDIEVASVCLKLFNENRFKFE